MDKYVPIEKCIDLSADEINAQIERRKKMRDECIGWLYTSILSSEIGRLYDMKLQREGI